MFGIPGFGPHMHRRRTSRVQFCAGSLLATSCIMGFLNRLTGRSREAEPDAASDQSSASAVPAASSSELLSDSASRIGGALAGAVPEFSSAASPATDSPVRLYNPYQVQLPLQLSSFDVQPQVRPSNCFVMMMPDEMSNCRPRVAGRAHRASMRQLAAGVDSTIRPTNCRSSRSSSSAKKQPCIDEPGVKI